MILVGVIVCGALLYQRVDNMKNRCWRAKLQTPKRGYRS